MLAVYRPRGLGDFNQPPATPVEPRAGRTPVMALNTYMTRVHRLRDGADQAGYIVAMRRPRLLLSRR